MKLEIEGNYLFHLLVKESGIPEEEILPVLKKLMAKLDLNPYTLDTDDVRRIIFYYLEECKQELKNCAEIHSWFGPRFSTDGNSVEA